MKAGAVLARQNLEEELGPVVTHGAWFSEPQHSA